MTVTPGQPSAPGSFQLFSEYWLDLQTTFAQVGHLPHDEPSFRARYGRFEDQQGVQEFVDALAEVQRISQKFGSPTSVKKQIAQDSNYLFGKEPPGELYGHLIWLATQIHNAAATFYETLSTLEPLLDPSQGDARQRAAKLKSILVGPGGLMQTADNIVGRIEALNAELEPFESTLLEYVRTFNQTKLVNQANQTIGALEAKIQTQHDQAAAAYETWKGKALSETAEAEPLSVGGGEAKTDFVWPWQRKKEKARQEYEDLMWQIAAEAAEVQQKALFIGDLKGFFIAGNRIVPAVQEIQNNLNKIKRVFVEAAERMDNTVTLGNRVQLSDYGWLAKALEIPSALQQWQAIANAAQTFTSNSLVSFGTEH